MNLFQSIGMRVATATFLGGFGASACAPTAVSRQARSDAYVLAYAPSWVLHPPSGKVVGQTSCSPESPYTSYGEYMDQRHEAARDANAAIYRQYRRVGSLIAQDAEDEFTAVCTFGPNGTLVLSSRLYLIFSIPHDILDHNW